MSASDPYTTEVRLCDDDGWVSHELVTDRKEVEAEGTTYLKRMNVLLEKTAWARGDLATVVEESFQCTGHAHLAGEHILCNSPAHERSTGPTEGIYLDTRAWSSEAARQRERGESCRRIAREMREAVLPEIKDDGTRESVARDLDQIEEVGQWLVSAQVLDGNKLGFRVTGLR